MNKSIVIKVNMHKPFIKTHSCMSMAKKDMRHMCKLFADTIKSLISASCISKTIGLIFTDSHILCSTYTYAYKLTYQISKNWIGT